MESAYWTAVFTAVGLLTLTAPEDGATAAPSERWRGLVVEPENRCTPYERRHYHYPQSVELRIIDRQGGEIVSPYTGETFASRYETDIEHIVAVSEAHDSGMCRASREQRRAFAQDLDNLTLASPQLNRHQKSGKDAGDWVPQQNRCWFAETVVAVKRKWKLSVDPAERNALEAILVGCDAPPSSSPSPTPSPTPTPAASPSAVVQMHEDMEQLRAENAALHDLLIQMQTELDRVRACTQQQDTPQ